MTETREYTVCGSYPGAVSWTIWTDETPAALAERLCESAGCRCYTVDGVRFHRRQVEETPPPQGAQQPGVADATQKR